MRDNEKKSAGGFFKIFGIFSFVILIIIGVVFIGKCAVNKKYNEENAFTKPIDTTDLALDYTIYEGSRIWATVTPLVDIKDLKVTISCHQTTHILHQLNQSFEYDFLKKGNSFSYEFDISDSYPFDRVGLYNITGHKKENSVDLTEEKRVGIIKAPKQDLNTELFTLRFDSSYDYGNSTDNDRFFGRLYITSSINLWDATIGLDYDFYNSHYIGGHYQPDFEKIIANKEFYVDMYKPLGGEENISLKSIQIDSATGRTVEPIVING